MDVVRAVGDKLTQIDQHPAIRMTPQQYATAVNNAGAGLMSTAVQKLDRATDEAVRERHALAAMIGTMDGQRRLKELATSITHFKFLKTAIMSRFPDFKPTVSGTPSAQD